MLLPCTPLADLITSLAPELAHLATALALPPAWQRQWLDAPTSPWRLLVRLVYVLPASAAHHACGEGGLARHLLRVASISAQRHHAARATASEPDAADDGHRDPDQEARTALIIALAGSLREVGVLWRMVVHSPAGQEWPRLRYLSDWAQAQHASRLSVAWTAGVRRGEEGHGALGAALLALVLPAELGQLLAPAGINRLLALITAAAPPAPGAQLALITAAASQARSDGLEPPAADLPRPPRDHPCVTTADACRRAVRKLIARHDQVINRIEAPVLRSASHTVLFLATDRDRSLMPELYDDLRRAGHLPGGSSAGVTWPIVESLLNELAERQLPDETPWCVAADGPAAAAAERLIHQLIVTDPQRGLTRRAPALIMRNRALGTDAPLLAAPFPGWLRCCQDHRGQGSVDAEDLGFLSAPAAADGIGPCAIAAGLILERRVMTTADTVRDLEEVVRSLLEVTGVLTRTFQPALDHARWQGLVAALPAPLPATLLIDVLEAVIDQLQDLRQDALPPC